MARVTGALGRALPRSAISSPCWRRWRAPWAACRTGGARPTGARAALCRPGAGRRSSRSRRGPSQTCSDRSCAHVSSRSQIPLRRVCVLVAGGIVSGWAAVDGSAVVAVTEGGGCLTGWWRCWSLKEATLGLHLRRRRLQSCWRRARCCWLGSPASAATPGARYMHSINHPFAHHSWCRLWGGSPSNWRPSCEVLHVLYSAQPLTG